MDGVNMSITATNNAAFFLDLRNNCDELISNYTIPFHCSEAKSISQKPTVSHIGRGICETAIGGVLGGLTLGTSHIPTKSTDSIAQTNKSLSHNNSQMPVGLLKKINEKEENLDIYGDIVSYCIEKNIDEVTLYTKAFVSKAGFSKIRSMKTTGYRPSKSTIICLCLALNLNLKQTQELLNKAGYMLSNDIFIDKIVAYCIEANFFNIYDIKSLLSEKMQRPVLFKA